MPLPWTAPLLGLLGLLSFGLGVLGVLLPFFPGLPFLFLAAICWFRAVPAWYARLRRVPVLRDWLLDWERTGTIRPVLKRRTQLALAGGGLATAGLGYVAGGWFGLVCGLSLSVVWIGLLELLPVADSASPPTTH